MRTCLMVKRIASFLIGIGVVLILWGAVLPHSVAASAELRGGTCCTTTALQRCPDQSYIGSCTTFVYQCDGVLAGFDCNVVPGPCDSATLLCRKLRQEACNAIACQ